MNHIFDPFNLVLIAVAALVFWRLKSVLGTRTGQEQPPIDFGPKAEPPTAGVKREAIPASKTPPDSKSPLWQGHAKEGSPEARGLEAIAAADSQFSVPEFLEGAKTAYEMIVTSFAQDNKEALKPLLGPEVLRSFGEVIDDRKKRSETLQSKLVRIRTAEIETAELEGRTASITIRFVSEFITATLGPEGEVRDGDLNRIQDITDVWTFERDVKSRDPNWKLVATGAEG